VRIVTAERSDVLRVPDQALRYTPGGLARATKDAPGIGVSAAHLPQATGLHAPRVEGAIWRLKSGEPVRVPIEIGLDDDAYTEVLSGELAAGDEIIVGESGGAAGASAVTSAPRLRGL
jgi:HlyD family secretion protein